VPASIEDAISDVQLVSRHQIAALLGFNVQTVDRLARRGVLPSVQIGHQRRFPIRQIEQMIRDQLVEFTEAGS